MARSSRRVAIVLLCAAALYASAAPNAPSEHLLVARHGAHEEVDKMVASAPTHSSMPPMQHSHHHAGPIKNVLDPELLLPFEESYAEYDGVAGQGHGGLMSAHIGIMVIAWAGLLPLGIMFRAVHHPLFFPLQILFIGLNFLGVVLARMYNALTPNHYAHDSHSRMGYFFLVYAAAVMSVDLFRAARSLFAWVQGDRQPGKLVAALLGKCDEVVEKDEYEPLQEELDSPDGEEEGDWANPRHSHVRRNTSESAHSDETLHDNEGNVSYRPGSVSPDSRKQMETSLPEPADFHPKQSAFRVFLKYLHIFSIRMLVFFGWTQLCTGVIVYTGTCKGDYINGCLAHYIKGSIFVWYGVITFGRYLGAWSELGWAWNKKPTSGWRSRMPTPEMIEVGHMFFYGSTNTFMERFGVPAGTPFTIHELEHISIAIMFFGTGLLGILLELKSFRRLISLKPFTPENARSSASHGWSWNFIPALTVALTGLVMSKHHQEYQFAVDVHALWGQLFVLFGVFRMMTYVFLWLRPPTVSVLPSRPPTEALASFCLIAGGVLFICSSEEIVFAAMRAEVADTMLFLNLTTTFVTIFMAWIVALLTIKGWAYRRMQGAYMRVSSVVNLS